ncbi:hypothetical protein HHK36_008761 [Tetracentron sinense]|uniref:Peptidase A1 domain-containing protein n=1 Tax=Tetracentron sinense TaxID=13715 RepID=A0A834ZN67_TETSI|nr:hypothetical protein HHK36_008761 [Tetracentron sinense]
MTTTIANPGRLVVELVHRDSPLSPIYDPNITIYDRTDRALKRSIKRHAYLSAKQRDASTTGLIRGEVMPDPASAEYLAKILIGTPPMEAFFMIDTGSDLLWTQCQPCFDCYKQPGYIYDPKKSSTYFSLGCNSRECKDIPVKMRGCRRPNTCTYNYDYGDGSYSSGTLGYEYFELKNSDGNSMIIRNATFGCGNKNKNTNARGAAGILGHLVLGNGSFINGFRTPMTIGSNGLYYLTLVSIRVRETILDIKPGTFDLKPDGSGGLVIDSGSPYTLLTIDAYIKVRDAIYKELSLFDMITQVPDPTRSHRMCFEGVANSDLGGFPDVTFIFKEDVYVHLYQPNIFVQVNDDVFCMAFYPVSAEKMSVFGNFAQQFYNIGYDLDSKRVSFEIIDCSVF